MAWQINSYVQGEREALQQSRNKTQNATSVADKSTDIT